jgi:hypothetical protein
MYRRLLLLVCVTFIVLLSFSGYAKDELAFEAEDFDNIQPPMQIVEDNDVSGGKYIKSPSGRAGWVEYEIEIPDDDKYYMWGMVQEHDGVTAWAATRVSLSWKKENTLSASGHGKMRAGSTLSICPQTKPTCRSCRPSLRGESAQARQSPLPMRVS